MSASATTLQSTPIFLPHKKSRETSDFEIEEDVELVTIEGEIEGEDVWITISKVILIPDIQQNGNALAWSSSDIMDFSKILTSIGKNKKIMKAPIELFIATTSLVVTGLFFGIAFVYALLGSPILNGFVALTGTVTFLGLAYIANGIAKDYKNNS